MRDLKDPKIKKELEAYRDAIELGVPFSLQTLRPYTRKTGEEWFASLRMDPQTMQLGEAASVNLKARPVSLESRAVHTHSCNRLLRPANLKFGLISAIKNHVQQGE